MPTFIRHFYITLFHYNFNLLHPSPYFTTAYRDVDIYPVLVDLVDKDQCPDSDHTVQVQNLVKESESLASHSSEYIEKLKEANKHKQYTAAVKDLEFWLAEVCTPMHCITDLWFH